MIDVPRVDPARVDFGYGPCERVLADPFGENEASLGVYFLRVVKANDAARRTEDYSSGDYRPKKRSAPCFVEASDTQPAALSRFAFVTPAAEPFHVCGF